VDGADHRRVHALEAADGRVQVGRPGLDDAGKLRKILDEGADVAADREETAFGGEQDGADIVPGRQLYGQRAQIAREGAVDRVGSSTPSCRSDSPSSSACSA